VILRDPRSPEQIRLAGVAALGVDLHGA
jgi:hypothetical protein